MSIQELSQKLIDDMATILAGGTVEPVVEDNTNDKSDDGEGLDKVQSKAVKKKFKDRKDKDIDNDGDTDDSDEYLHKKRKAISKNIKQDEGKLPPALQKAIDAKKGKDDDDEDEDDVEEGTLPPALQKAIDKKKGKEDDSEDEDEDKEDQKEGKYAKYSDLLLKKQRMSDSADKSSINKEIKKERQKLGISEENLEDLLIHYLPEQEK
jgi:hypothetical protein